MTLELTPTENISTKTPPEGVRIIDAPDILSPTGDSLPSLSMGRHASELVRTTEVNLQAFDEEDDRIPKEVRVAFTEQDTKINTQLEKARAELKRAVDAGTINVNDLKASSDAAIERTRQSVIDKEKEAAEIRDAIIVAAIEQYNLTTGKQRMRAVGYITEHGAVLDAATAFLEEATAIASKIENGIDTTLQLQFAHESTRDKAVKAIDVDNARRTELTRDIQIATNDVFKKVQARIVVEHDKKLLLNKESELRIEEDRERTRSLAPYKAHFIEKLGMEPDSEVLKNALAQIELDKDFERLKEISTELKTYPEKFEDNKGKFDTLSDEIAELHVKIRKLKAEYDQIPDKIAQSKAIVANEVAVVSPVQEGYSQGAASWAETYAKVTTGDLTTTNEVPIPPGMKELRQLKLNVYKAVRAVNKEDPLEGIHDPLLNPELEGFVHLTPQSREALIEGVGRAQMRNSSDREITTIKRGTGADIRGVVIDAGESMVDAGIEIGGFAIRGIKKAGEKIKYVRTAKAKE